ncbi:MAG: CRISPR-associated ring nuclease Csm6 [Gammaproteobacteria bacterium]
MEHQRLQSGDRTSSTPKKNVLLCVASECPQVVTQTIYGLAHMPRPWVPDEVVVITGQRGARRIEASLVGDGHFQGVFGELARRLTLKVPVATARLCLEVMTRSCKPNAPLYSLETVRHRRDIGNSILKTVQRITDDDDTQLWISLGPDQNVVASFLAGHALSLLGRPQDRLVQAVGTDSDPGMAASYYPSAAHGEGDQPARICDVPFARIEGLASVRNLARQVDYSTLCHGLDGNAHLQISSVFSGLQFRFSNAFDVLCDSSHRRTEPRFEPRAAALYAYYAERARRGAPFVTDDQTLDEPDEFLALYEACLVGGGRKSESDGSRGLTREALRSARSRIGRTLQALVKNGASFAAYRIYSRRSERSYGLGLQPEQIAFIDWAGADAWQTSPYATVRC